MNNLNERNEYKMRTEIESLYERIIECNSYQINNEMKCFVSELLKYQKKDGSFSVIDNYNCESDYRVDFAYFPTYYATAALMFADLNLIKGLDADAKKCLVRGLHFASSRNLMGHGFDAVNEMIKALRLYAKAGMYRWININAEVSPEFKSVIDEHYKNFVNNVSTGKTYCDWNRDFAEEFKREIHDYESECVTYIWYAAYGSNINTERFMKYINNCSDKSAPKAAKTYEFQNSIYFAKKSSLWNGAVAFLDDSKHGRAMGKIYLVKKSQFEEIMKKEGTNYSKKLFLGKIDGSPVYTFTSAVKINDDKVPSAKYLETILKGLTELYPEKSKIALELYLFTRTFLSEDCINVLSSIRNSNHAIKLSDISKQTGISKTRVSKAVKSLYLCGLVVQDSRSRTVRISEESSMVYTYKEKREVIDNLIVKENY